MPTDTTDRSPKACRHPFTRHRHGTRDMYFADQCRCHQCTAANSAYQRERRRLAPYGRTPKGWVDAEPARAHVQRLQAAGLGRRLIATRAGLDTSLIYGLTVGRKGKPSVRIAPSTERRLLAVPIPDSVDQLAPGVVLDGTGTRRRLQALIAIGWTQGALARRIGWSQENLARVIHGYGSGQVTVRTRRLAAALYDRLSMTPPAASVASTNARAYAAGHRWPPPLAWDDDTIDDPAARPDRGWTLRHTEGPAFDEVAVERAMAGDKVTLRPVERAEVIHRLTAAGLSAAQIAPRVGIDKRSVQRVRDQRRTAGEAA